MPTPRIAKVRAASRAQVCDPDIYNKLLYRINSDPYSLTQEDVISADGISLADKNKAIEELQRNQEITNRPNYKAARELFDIDFKQQFGGVLEEEEKATWLRVFHSYIIDKKWNRWTLPRRSGRIIRHKMWMAECGYRKSEIPNLKS
ncbi:MAG: hypothetical protein DPW20_18535 [Candidatus Brocadia sp.]|uniref:Calcineurin B-like protein 3 n=1 Tax=Candidatus Brocadia sinica JPN1 TaxID=1197129 RepID=A0ABQ0JSW1_9BACT|nr:hypothetical protein [Candidatus Brocadia sinica]KAA0244960.1 MAG: hypothetical protein EDM75_15480 [Chlorobiota bacterium]MBL1170304.1 hypothetical protein [Candidatus Brocadia sp. AMX1]MCQ3919331.1 hypothetical protein [Candidatus Brocadia sp.]NOG43397.1 hypothetical protein [Planctomycetota bacterium]GAN31812.1 calcineurin B-like protein 3 [Candidatus Brocadia sinica JPN1]